MPRLTITRGIPGSGKSTTSRQLTAASHGKLKRICKDDLRHMMDTTPDFGLLHMRQYNELIEDMTRTLLFQGFDVILDETFMRCRDIKNIYLFHLENTVLGKFPFELEIIDLTQIPFDECLRRDKARERSLGYEVLLDYKETLEREGTTCSITESLQESFGLSILVTTISSEKDSRSLVASRYSS